MKAQCHNPYLPLYEHIPDGEPHVFGNRLYIFGSHDLENGLEIECYKDLLVSISGIRIFLHLGCLWGIMRFAEKANYSEWKSVTAERGK